MKPVLLTVSGTVPADLRDQIERGDRPQADYLSLAEAFHADIIDYAGARQCTGWFGRILERLGGPDLVLAWACFRLRKKYKLIFTDGEQVGIPLAMFMKFLGFSLQPKHFMICHILSVKKKMFFFDLFRIQNQISHFFVYSSRQKEFIERRWNIPDERVTFIPFMVDHHFFSPEKARPGDPLHILEGHQPVICSVGLEFRDYPTLIEAVRGLDIKVFIAAGSPWSKRKDTTKDISIPENITVRRFTQYDLRELYAASQVMVMPLYPVEFQAGITAILEAFSMGKPVICSRTPGQTDVIVDGKNGVYVPPQDVVALRQAILDMLNHPEKAQCIGLAGRQTIQDDMNLEKYSERLSMYVKKAIA